MRLRQQLVTGTFALVTAGLLSLPFAPSGAWADTSASLSLSPSHGTATTPLTLVYRASRVSSNHPGIRLDCTGSVTFLMDAPVLGTAPLVADGDYCVATLNTKPPANLNYDKPGAHTMRTRPASSTDQVATVYATYTIDAGPTKAAGANPAQAPTKASAPRPGQATTTRAAVAATARSTTRPATVAAAAMATPTSGAASAPVATVTTASAPASVGGSASTLPVIALSGASGGGARPWVLAVLGVLVLCGAAGLGLIAHRRRRAPAE